MIACQKTMAKAKAGNNEAARVMYLNYVNEFLTVAGFSDYYGIGHYSGQTYLQYWRELHEEHCAYHKGLI